MMLRSAGPWILPFTLVICAGVRALGGWWPYLSDPSHVLVSIQALHRSASETSSTAR